MYNILAQESAAFKQLATSKDPIFTPNMNAPSKLMTFESIFRAVNIRSPAPNIKTYQTWLDCLVDKCAPRQTLQEPATAAEGLHHAILYQCNGSIATTAETFI